VLEWLHQVLSSAHQQSKLLDYKQVQSQSSHVGASHQNTHVDTDQSALLGLAYLLILITQYHVLSLLFLSSLDVYGDLQQFAYQSSWLGSKKSFDLGQSFTFLSQV